jgi:PAS domain S-box-containing protein
MGFISWDTDFKVSSWNKASETIFGYSSKEAIGNHAEFIVPPAARKQVDEVWQGLMALDGGIRSKNENITKNGETILCDWYNSPLIASSGKVIGVLSLVEDVTEQELMEKELLKVKKLESTGMLAGGIAHDFNNILTAILGNISLSKFDKTLKNKTKTLLEEAEKASIRARSLTQQLLTFAKGGEPVKESTSLADVVRDSANFVLSGNAIACRYTIPDDLWLVEIDKGQISQVIQNIVLNASHAMTNGGIIEITCANIDEVDKEDVPLPGDMNFVKIAIEDSGIGVPANVIDKIFDPYFSTKQKGSGLGLAITHSIITKHGGHIFVKSKPGVGTIFTTYLPASAQARSVDSDPEDFAHPSRKAKIMVMDDEEIVRDVARAMLTKMGHEVVLANDGLEATKLYKAAAESSEPIHLVIMDLTIPGGMGGKDAVKVVLAINPEAIVLVSSGYSNDPILSSYQKYGFCGVVVKPYRLQELSKIVEMVLHDQYIENNDRRPRHLV